MEQNFCVKEREFVRSMLGIEKERLEQGEIFTKRREWLNTLRAAEERIKRHLEEHGGSRFPEAGYRTWKYLREREGETHKTPEDIVASARKLEELIAWKPKRMPGEKELEQLAIAYGAMREVREALERADGKTIFRWYLERKPFLDYLGPLIVLEAKKRGLDPRRVAEEVMKIWG